MFKSQNLNIQKNKISKKCEEHAINSVNSSLEDMCRDVRWTYSYIHYNNIYVHTYMIVNDSVTIGKHQATHKINKNTLNNNNEKIKQQRKVK